MGIKHTFLIRPSDKKINNEHTVFLRIALKKETKYIGLPISVKANHWDSRNSLVRKGDPFEKIKNELLQNKKIAAQKIIFDASMNNTTISLEDFISNFSNESEESCSFFDYAYNLITKEYEGQKAEGTIKRLRSFLNNLKKFDPELTLSQIDKELIIEFRKYCICELNHTENTTKKNLANFKTFVKHAFDNGKLQENPFDNITIGEIKSEKEFLTPMELKRINDAINSNSLSKNEIISAKGFLFCCYTGLRYSDYEALRFSQIVEIDDLKYISIEMQKTDKKAIIPIVPQALALIDKKDNFKEARVFNAFTNQAANRHLKDITQELNIDKRVTFHTARHTFATNAINNRDIPMDIVKDILGHSDIKITQIYAKNTPQRLAREMHKIKE